MPLVEDRQRARGHARPPEVTPFAPRIGAAQVLKVHAGEAGVAAGGRQGWSQPGPVPADPECNGLAPAEPTDSEALPGLELLPPRENGLGVPHLPFARR